MTEQAPVPDRRRRDPLLDEILKRCEATSLSVASLTGSLTRLERMVFDVRKDLEDFHFGDMGKDRKELLGPMLTDYEKRKDDVQEQRERTDSWVRFSAIMQGITATVMAGIAIYLLFRH